MRLLMRNTVFKTVTLAGLFSCMLMLAGAFSGTTTSVHAITADEVQTEADLEQFVKEAIDEYYIKTIIQACDFSTAPFADTLARFIDLATATVDDIRPLISSFSLVGLTSRSDVDPYCDFSQRFDEVFGREDGDWKSGSIYLFIMDDNGKMLFNGADSSIEGRVLVAQDEGRRDVPQSIIDEAETSGKDGGTVRYCWDDPDVEGDEIVDSNGDPIPGKAPGDSLKISYVVDPFEYYEAPDLSASPGVIFGSGIYPGRDSQFPECDGNGMADGGEEMMEEEMEEMEEEMEETEDVEDMVEEVAEDVVDSVSGGGCAIAAGSDSTPRSDALNLLLIVSALLFTVSFGNRAVGRRNGNSS